MFTMTKSSPNLLALAVWLLVVSSSVFIGRNDALVLPQPITMKMKTPFTNIRRPRPSTSSSTTSAPSPSNNNSNNNNNPPRNFSPKRNININNNNNNKKNREWAGAESMFSTASTMRKNNLSRIKGAWKRSTTTITTTTTITSISSKNNNDDDDNSNNNNHHHKNPWKIIKLRRQQRRRRRRKHHGDNNNNNNNNQEELLSKIDLWGIEKARQELSLPKWACNSNNDEDSDGEERRLAAMKIILENDLKQLQSKTIVISNDINNNGNKNGRMTTTTTRKVVKVVDLFPDVYSDLRLLRFLRKDKVQDPVTAAVRYRNFLQWRKDNNIDETIRLRVESHPFEPPKHLLRVGELLPCIFRPEKATKIKDDNKKNNKNSSGSASGAVVPVLLQVGSWDSTTITKLIRESKSNNSNNYNNNKNNNNNNNDDNHINQQDTTTTTTSSSSLTLDSFLEYWIYMFESIHKHLYEESLRHEEMIFIDEICDLQGMNLSQFSPTFISTVMKPWLDLTQSNYPETVKRIIFLHPPNVLFAIWKLVTPLASPGTVAKISLNTSFQGTGQEFYKTKYGGVGSGGGGASSTATTKK